MHVTITQTTEHELELYLFVPRPPRRSYTLHKPMEKAAE